MAIPGLDRGAGPPVGREPVGYLTTSDLATFWEERRRAALRHRQEHPDDLKGIEQRQRLATQALQTYRLLADLEVQLGFVLGLPVLGMRAAGNGSASPGPSAADPKPPARTGR